MTKHTDTETLPHVAFDRNPANDNGEVTIKAGAYRPRFDNSEPKQLHGMPEEMRNLYLQYTYASQAYPGVRYVRGDRFIRALPSLGHEGTGLNVECALDREAAHKMAELFILVAHGPNAARVNPLSLDVSPNNILRTEGVMPPSAA